MPLLEVIQTRHLSASIRLTDTTALQVDQYAAFIRATADEVVEQALAYVFSKDRDFQEFLKSAEAQTITPTLRVRRVPASEPGEQHTKKPQTVPPMAAFQQLPWEVREPDPPSSSVAVPQRCCAPDLFRHSTPKRVVQERS